MKKAAAFTFALLVASACSGGDKIGGPSGPTETVSLDFCSIFRPSWMAIQNQGEEWKAITVSTSGPVTFEATEKVSVAMTFALFGNFTFVFNVARDELPGTSVLLSCEDFGFGNRELNGTVSGLGASDFASISAATASTSADVFNSNWTLEGLPTTPVDLVATRVPDLFTQTPDRVIVRRGVTPGLVGSAPIATLNFAASDAVPPESATLTLSGAGSDFVDVTSTFMTANGTMHLMSIASANGSSYPFHSVPASLRTATDFHELVVTASNDVGFRDITHFYKTPADKEFTFGPMVGVATTSTVATSPVRRMRAQVASQAEYPTAMTVTFSQTETCGEGCFDFRIVGVLTSAAFLGGRPATWDLTIPDMSPAGYQPEWGLANNATPVEWDITAFGGSAGVFLVAPVEGATVTSASRSSSGSNTRAARIGPSKRSNPRLFGPMGSRGRR